LHTHPRDAREATGDELEVRADAALRADRQVAVESGDIGNRIPVWLKDVPGRADDERPLADQVPKRGRKRLLQPGGAVRYRLQRIDATTLREAAPLERAHVLCQRSSVHDLVAQTIVDEVVEQARQRREEEAGEADERK
jgi:hypothetical protein